MVTWAARFAAATSSELVVFYWADSMAIDVQSISADGEEEISDPTLSAIRNVVESVVKTSRAKAGRLPRHLVSILRISDPDPLPPTLRRIRAEDPDLIVAAESATSGAVNTRTVTRQLIAQVPCEKVLLYGDSRRSVNAAKVLVATTEGPHDKAAIRLAAGALSVSKGTLTVLQIEPDVVDEAAEVGRRSLRSLLNEVELEESKNLKIKVALGDQSREIVADEAINQDLLLVGADSQADVAGLLEDTKKPLIGAVHRAPQFGFWGRRARPLTWVPRLNPTDYADLYEKLQAGSRWNVDFMLMLGLASAIATLGLIQSSPAVVIGSMLLAPLMTPMIGMGLALNQGNAKLARACLRSIGRGFLATLIISYLIGWITPGMELTSEVLSRTEPNILDLLIALFSGMAAAYAMARPSLVGTVAGVAIATAIVPPLCSAGIALSYDNVREATGAASLLAANLLAIMLAAALTFRAMGLRARVHAGERPVWVRRALVGLSVCALVLALPLASSFYYQIHRGKSQPIAFPVTNEVREAVAERVEAAPGVTLITIARPGLQSEDNPIDVGIVIASERPLPRSFADELTAIVRDQMEDDTVRVKVGCVADGWEKSETNLAVDPPQ